MGRRAVRPHLATLTQEVEPEVDCLLLMVICLSLLPCRRDRHHSRILAAATEEDMATLAREVRVGPAPEAQVVQVGLALVAQAARVAQEDLVTGRTSVRIKRLVAMAVVTLSFASCFAPLLLLSRHKQSTFTGGKTPIGKRVSR